MQKRKKNSIFFYPILFLCLLALFYSGYRFYGILSEYYRADREYEQISKEYTEPNDATVPDASTHGEDDTWPLIEDAEPPLTPNWDELKAVNSDLVGWLYVGAVDISYPIVQADDDDYYLHRTFEKTYLFAGSIFEEALNDPHFSDMHTLVYGHNMKNGSMFAGLKKMKDQELYDSDPYFWILTPEGNYRYHIISIFDTRPMSDIYQLFDSDQKPKFLAWEKAVQKASVPKNNVSIDEDGNDLVVTLSTCNTSEKRTVVIGRCCSSGKPVRKAVSEQEQTEDRENQNS